MSIAFRKYTIAVLLSGACCQQAMALSLDEINQCISSLNVTQDSSQLTTQMTSCARIFTSRSHNLFRTADGSTLLFIRKDLQSKQVTQAQLNGNSIQSLYNLIKQLGADNGTLPVNYSQWYQTLPAYRF